MPNQFQELLTPNFISLYLFGGLLILLYAKDKFNKPTYDGSAMGPFAQLPPERLTIDRRYRSGWATYVFMLLAFYTAICIIGPKTFPNLFDAMKSLQPQFQAGPQPANVDMWPVAAATFLISTGAMSDSSILGRIEYLIRQYAHKTAYIPRTVRDLARYFRQVQPHEWLEQPQRDDEKAELKRALEEAAGKAVVADIEKAGKAGIFGEKLVWVRANILFLILERKVYKATVEMPGARLDEVKKIAGNETVHQELQATQANLKNKVVGPNGDFIPDKGDVTKFLRDVSLTLSVLVSQAARNQAEIDGYVRQLGLSDIHFRSPDSATFSAPVSTTVLFGALVSVVLAATLHLKLMDFDLFGATRADDIIRPINVFPCIAIVITATVSYVVSLRVITYFRDNAMDALEWTEDLSSYLRLILASGAISAVISVITIVLIFTIINKLDHVAGTRSQIAQLIVTQFVLATLVSAFSVYYFRAAARLSGKKATFIRCLINLLPIGHAVLAALLVGLISFVTGAYANNERFVSTQFAIDSATNSLFESQNFVVERYRGGAIAALRDVIPAPEATSTVNVGAQVSADEGAAKTALAERAIAEEKARLAAADKAAADIIKSGYEKLQGVRYEIARGFTKARGLEYRSNEHSGDEKNGLTTGASAAPVVPAALPAEWHTKTSLELLGDVCGSLDGISLSPPQPVGTPQPSCSAPNSAAGAQAGAPTANSRLNLTEATGSPPPSSAPGRAPGPVSPSSGPLKFTLFALSGACVPNSRSTLDCKEKPFVDLGASLFRAYQQTEDFHYQVSRRLGAAGTGVATITAFFVAYAFGVGFLFRRAAWLREGLDEPHGVRLREQIEESYGQKISEEVLVKPVRLLGNVSSLEALRYEEYNFKLSELVKEKKVDEYKDNPDNGGGDAQSGSVHASFRRFFRAVFKLMTRSRSSPQTSA